MSTLAAESSRLARTRDAVSRGAQFVEALPARRVIGAFIVMLVSFASSWEQLPFVLWQKRTCVRSKLNAR